MAKYKVTGYDRQTNERISRLVEAEDEDDAIKRSGMVVESCKRILAAPSCRRWAWVGASAVAGLALVVLLASSNTEPNSFDYGIQIEPASAEGVGLTARGVFEYFFGHPDLRQPSFGPDGKPVWKIISHTGTVGLRMVGSPDNLSSVQIALAGPNYNGEGMNQWLNLKALLMRLSPSKASGHIDVDHWVQRQYENASEGGRRHAVAIVDGRRFYFEYEPWLWNQEFDAEGYYSVRITPAENSD